MFGKLRSALKPKQRLFSTSFELIILDMVKDCSYRDAVDKLNRLFHRVDNGTTLKLKTVSDYIEAIGGRIDKQIEQLVSSILDDHDYDKNTGLPLEEAALPDSVVIPRFEDEEGMGEEHRHKVEQAIIDINKTRSEQFRIHKQHLEKEVEFKYDNCVYICIDDVGVDHQKDTRKNGGSKKGKVIEHTDIHIEYQHMKYSITHVGQDEAFRRMIAFLLENDLFENKHFIFLTDGAKSIKKAIEKYFPYRSYRIILDWFHLQKHSYEAMSMAIKGKKEYKHQVQADFNRYIWIGAIDEAIAYLRTIDKSHIKNELKLQETIDYLNRKKPYVVCYALRKEMGLPNSSNPVEKDNDLNVAARQKHNGMAWNIGGSDGLAKVTVLFRNGEMDSWLRKEKIPFVFPQTRSNCLYA